MIENTPQATDTWINHHDSSSADFSKNKKHDWQGKPYHPISRHYRECFGTKVFKVSVSVAETCPNREGLNGSKICSFCDEWGSAAYHLEREKPLSEQIKINREAIRKRYRAERFLVYFQAYTNTLGKVQKLQDWFDAGESHIWEAKESFKLTLGNTAVMFMMLDGREIEFDRSKNLLEDWVIHSNPNQ